MSGERFRLTIELNETDAKIEKKMIKYLAKKINKKIKRAGMAGIDTIKPDIKRWIYDSATLVQLRSASKLRGDLGLTSTLADRASDQIATAVAESITATFKPWDNKLTGGGNLTVKVQGSDFANLLGASWAKYTTEKGDSIPWLSWLLERGDDIIITGYEVEYGNFGRSGQGRMTGDGSGGGMAFRIDPSFSGTKDRNFITEALTGPDQLKEIRKLLVKFITY